VTKVYTAHYSSCVQKDNDYYTFGIGSVCSFSLNYSMDCWEMGHPTQEQIQGRFLLTKIFHFSNIDILIHFFKQVKVNCTPLVVILRVRLEWKLILKILLFCILYSAIFQKYLLEVNLLFCCTVTHGTRLEKTRDFSLDKRLFL
jgi:hypothetical protein